MIEHFCVSLHCVYTVINEIITYLQKKPDVFHQVDSIIGYYIGYSNSKFAITLSNQMSCFMSKLFIRIMTCFLIIHLS